MKRILFSGLLMFMLLAMTGFTQPLTVNAQSNSAGSQVYTVLVGAEKSSLGVSLMSFFPETLQIHVGDTVQWKINSNEIHTVTFLAGGAMPDLLIPAPAGQPSPLMFNAAVAFPTVPNQGLYDGSTYVNSGIMGRDAGQAQVFDLTFTQAGSFDYVCVIHGYAMSGTIEVVDSSTPVLSPVQVYAQAKREIGKQWAKVPAVEREAKQQVQAPVKNADGTTTYHVLAGYESGSIMLMQFFPKRLTVQPGDTVIWDLPSNGEAPHTVTFLNGNEDPELILPVPQPLGPPLLLVNPEVLFPSDAVMNGVPLNESDFFNSGLLNPAGPTSFSLVIGDIRGKQPYICILHDTSGMTGALNVSAP